MTKRHFINTSERYHQVKKRFEATSRIAGSKPTCPDARRFLSLLRSCNLVLLSVLSIIAGNVLAFSMSSASTSECFPM